MRRITGAVIFSLLLWPGAVAWAQEEAPAICPAGAPAAPPAEYASWTSRPALASAAKAGDLAKAEIAPGKAVTARLHPTKEVVFVTQPEKPGGSVSRGGMLSLKIDQAGTYRVGIGSGAWLDVLKEGKVLDSASHNPGPACTGIRKAVDFALQPGRYVVQISANPADDLGVIVVRRP